MNEWQVRKSTEDESVNFIMPVENGKIECRYVRRRNDYFIIYVSSQIGCAQYCRMCHLTQEGQTNDRDCSYDDLIRQIDKVYEHYDKVGINAKIVHYNFMARGEPLSSKEILKFNQQIFNMFSGSAKHRNLYPRYLISTILPKTLNKELHEIFTDIHPDIYYSLYSLNDDFRSRWLPKAMDGIGGLRMLKTWQRYTKKIPKIHFAFIKGQNDSEHDIKHIANVIKDMDLRVDFNVVRYNRAPNTYQDESDESTIYKMTEIFKEILPESKVKIVPRVGYDVSASCGMFV